MSGTSGQGAVREGGRARWTMTVIVVTHNSERVLPKCVDALLASKYKDFRVVIVDSGSNAKDYLDKARGLLAEGQIPAYIVDAGGNVGFAKANNLGVLHPAVADSDFFVFLNPDAFVLPDTLSTAILEMTGSPEKERIGVLGGWLLGYDLYKDCPSGLIDSLGIGRAWYGKWYDIAQGLPVHRASDYASVRRQAACGALMFCRAKALRSLKGRDRGPFNESFFMYKEDIELSVMLCAAGWDMLVSPRINAYHCRGWSRERSSVPKKWRLMSARNEFTLDREFRSPYMLYSMLKFFYVRYLEQ